MINITTYYQLLLLNSHYYYHYCHFLIISPTNYTNYILVPLIITIKITTKIGYIDYSSL